MTAAIRIEELRRTFGTVQALNGLTLSVGEGTVFGFLGPNGAGKTTTLRILTGLARATGGRAWVAGAEVGMTQGAVAQRVGYLPEEPAFYPWMTPREYLDYVGRIYALDAVERASRIKELLALVGLEQVAGRRIGGFSRGMRQRLGLAQALVHKPPVLLLDEPVSALDPLGRKEVLGLIEGLRGSTTVFMSTHILADVERVCDTVAILAQGRLIAEAPREELIARYAVPVFELRADAGMGDALAVWADGLRALPWVDDVRVHGDVARIDVSDVDVAKQRLMALAAEAGLVLTRYELVRPSLEDVFVRLVGEGGESR